MPYSFNPLSSLGLDQSIPLDSAGKIPSGYLPSYVDDVEEYADLASFPATGETGKIYVAIDTGFTYRWSGSVYIQINSLTGTFAADSGTEGAPSVSIGTADNGLYAPGTDQVAISTNGTGRLFVDASGNVGVGTASPLESLHITDNIRLGDASPAEIYTNSSELRIGVDRNNDNIASDITFYVDNNERARIDDGRLLVGTSSARSNVAGYLDGTGSPQIQAESTLEAGASFGLFLSRNSTSEKPSIVLGRGKTTSIGSNGSVNLVGDDLGIIIFSGNDGTNFVPAASILSEVDGTAGPDDMPGRLVFSVTADGSASPTEALRISNDRSITVSDGGDVVLGTTTGTKIGTATSQKIGFYNATPVVQPTTGVAEAAFVENSGGTAVNIDSTFGGYTIQQVVEALQTLGLLA